jgi:hypothetical protein
MKVSNPYGADDTFRSPEQIVDRNNSKAAGKAKARFPHTPAKVTQPQGKSGGMKVRAYTPGSSPDGS